MRPFGYHISTAGNTLGTSLESTVSQGFTAAQIFLGPPQKFALSTHDEFQLRKFVALKRQSGIKVYCHAPYVLHAFAKPENKKKNNEAVGRFIWMCDQLELDGFVLHMGGTKWYELGDSVRVLGELLDTIRSRKTPLLLENCASGNALSGMPREICRLIDQCDGNDVGLCLDTCHAWAWGHDYTIEGVIDNLVKDVRDHIKLIHLNSAPEKVACGGKYDRHASIKEGVIPSHCFKQLLQALPGIPCVSERDSFQGVEDDRAFVIRIDEGGEAEHGERTVA